MDSRTDTRQRLLESARKLIYSRSYADVGVQAICQHANVKKGSFYHFFPSKKDLTLAVLDEIFIEFKTNMIGKAFSDDLPPMQRFSRMVEMALRFQQQVAESTGHILGCPFGNLAIEMSTQNEEIRQRIVEVFNDFQAATQQTLQDAIDAGEIGDIDIKATAQAMYAYLEGVLLMAKTHNDLAIFKTLAPAMADIRIARKA
jgi:TetR/AcrR family transcriptional repressor of nem operon